MLGNYVSQNPPVSHLSQHKAQSQEEDDTEYGQAAWKGDTKYHTQLSFVGCLCMCAQTCICIRVIISVHESMEYCYILLSTIALLQRTVCRLCVAFQWKTVSKHSCDTGIDRNVSTTAVKSLCWLCSITPHIAGLKALTAPTLWLGHIFSTTVEGHGPGFSW